MKSFNMAFPETVGEACQMLEDNPESDVIAGGTALSVVMKEGLFNPDLLINLRDLEEDLSYVREDDEVIRIGALTTLHTIERSELVQENLPVIVETLEEVASVRVRNSATIGGYLAYGDVHMDLPPVLGGYDAEVVIDDGSTERKLHVEEFLQGYYETALKDAELITEIVIPKSKPATQGTYIKHRYFSEVDWPCVGVAAFTESNGQNVTDVQVLLNSVSDTSILRLEGVNETLDGSLTDEYIRTVAENAREQVSPSDDLRGSAEYKTEMAGVFTERALRELQEV